MSILRRLAFSYWYYRNPPWDTGISPPELIDFITTHPPGQALDLGCGTGTNVVTLARHGWQATGIDFAIPAIRIAQRKIKQAGIQADLRVADVTRVDDLGGRFDLILDIGCLHGINPTERKKYLSKVERWLSPSGTYLVYLFINEGAQPNQSGLSEEDIDRMTRRFDLIERVNGVERGQRPSAWLTFGKKSSTTQG